MSKYRNLLPQLSGELFLSDGGLETTMVFKEGFDLPGFAAFVLLENDIGREALRKYYREYATIARDKGVGFVLESATWRANSSWGKKIGYSDEALVELNRKAISLLEEIRKEFENGKTKMVISGCMGPRGDGYVLGEKMTEEEAEAFHLTQIRTLAETNADLVAAFTLSYSQEATGFARAAKSVGMPAVISFTVETDGRLPSGESLKTAIETVDGATDSAPVYYMINCAHPTHFQDVLAAGEPWAGRIRALRANASAKSHAELDEATELDDGNPVELASQYSELKSRLINLNVLGGCCGTDHRHVGEMCKVWAGR
jgi:S-methylmethionine-dependent homocysteine/selenocysteine methylase